MVVFSFKRHGSVQPCNIRNFRDTGKSNHPFKLSFSMALKSGCSPVIRLYPVRAW